MIIRTISSLFLWSSIAGIVYAMDEIGAMWVLNLCATLTLFEIYTILGTARALRPTAFPACSLEAA